MLITGIFCPFLLHFQKASTIAQLVVWRTWVQEVAGSIPASANILFED